AISETSRLPATARPPPGDHQRWRWAPGAWSGTGHPRRKPRSVPRAGGPDEEGLSGPGADPGGRPVARSLAAPRGIARSDRRPYGVSRRRTDRPRGRQLVRARLEPARLAEDTGSLRPLARIGSTSRKVRLPSFLASPAARPPAGRS